MRISTGLLAILFLLIIGCQARTPSEETPQPPPTTVAPSPSASPTAVVRIESTDTPIPATVPPTWTIAPTEPEREETATAAPTSTAWATNTPFPTLTATPTQTWTPLPTPSPVPTTPPTPTPFPSATPIVSSGNLLPNPSFENGWYHVSGIAELQVPREWFFGWNEGENDLDPDPWNGYVRPESRVINADFLPAAEHHIFIWDGQWTLKVFKGSGSLYFWLATNVQLQPGTYIFEINVFPDMVVGYREDGQKIWAPDPLSAEVRFIHGSEVGQWILPTFGQKNTFHYTFDVFEPGQVRLGAAFRGRWAILNNGWFLDDWSLTQLAAGT